ncbi:MAG: SpoIIE family protein phosphatase [Flavobacteriales bacterium]|nr:SpoIIE family protein phosphatase [Flavobacteriales bacterium]MCB9446914.1 SpoIIE family protein phosphatase [Flavobacteriales bacterium]
MMRKHSTKRARCLVPLALLCFAWIGTRAQTSNFTHYGVENGLSQTQVQTLVQDDLGNLWIGTMAGLAKYDGRKFTAYRKDDGLSEDWITAAYKDREGNIWLGHWLGGVTKIDPKPIKPEITAITSDYFGQFKTITSILEDKDGKMWFGTEGFGILVYDGTDRIHNLSTKTTGLSSDFIYSMCTDPKGNIWIGTDNGISIYNQEMKVMNAGSFQTLTTENGLVSKKITTINLLGEDEMWIGTEDKGAQVINIAKDLQVTPGEVLPPNILGSFNVQSGMASNNVTSFAKDRENRIWMGSRDKGVSVFTPEKKDGKKVSLTAGTFKNYSVKQGLNYYRINTLLHDREDNMWIGTHIGLNQYRGEMFQIFDEDYGMVNNIVWSIMQDTRGNVWVGTNGGLSMIPKDSIQGHVKDDRLFTNYTTENGLSSNVVLCLHEDNFGNIWAGTRSGGACKIYKDAKGKEHIDVYDKSNGLADTVYAINSDHEGNIWFGTKEGAKKLDNETGKFTSFTARDGLGGNTVYTIFKDSQGALWFGILGGYLTHYDGYEFKIYKESDGLESKFIVCITEDEKSNIWFGTYGNGLYKFDGHSFSNYSVRDGLTSDSPYLLVCDDMNNLWIGTSQGIDKYDQKNQRFTHYGKQEGFLGIETNRNAVYKDSRGGIWFGTIMGAVKYNPNKNKENKQEPITRITGLKIFHNEVEFPPKKNAFHPDNNHLTFTFLGISLTNPEKVRYRYLLEGSDNHASPEQADNYAMFSNLGPGHYTLKVWACNGDKEWNKEPATYAFTILTPFYQTWWFFTLCVIAMILLIYIIVATRTRNLQRIRVVLEEQVNIRTRQLQQRNKDIMDSIRYAKRIQEAILPDMEIVRRSVPDSVIYYKPKDIVSGDFYWLEDKQDKVLFAAVDCTGHGVPGAFMSIVGHNILQNAVDEHLKTKPAAILDEMNKGVSATLRQTYEESSVKDGMDIALCTYDRKTRILEYAGAYNSLYHVRNGKLNVIKGDKFPVGIFIGEEMKKFTNHSIELLPGDVIYIASDGYADQFGGPKGKKFKYQRFQKLLVDMHQLPMQEQYELLDQTIVDWMGDTYEQIDDILVMGVKFP